MQALTSRLSVWHLKKAYHLALKDMLGNIESVKRLDRAYELLTRDERYSIEVTAKRPLTFEIKGPNDTYSVIPSEKLCTCPDFQVLCKHRLAVRLIVESVRLQQAENLTISLGEVCNSTGE